MANKKLSVDLNLTAGNYIAGTRQVITANKNMADSLQAYIQQNGSLTQQIHAHREALKNLAVVYNDLSDTEKAGDFGQELVGRMNMIRQSAGELQHVLKNTQDSMRFEASNTRTFDAIHEQMSSLGYTAMGTLGIIGALTGSTKNLTRAVTAWIGINKSLIAMRRIHNMFLENSKTLLMINRIQQLAEAKASMIAAAAKEKETGATIKATIAQKAFNAVASANPYTLLVLGIMAVVGAIGALVAIMNSESDAARIHKDMVEAQKDVTESYASTLKSTTGDYVENYEKLKSEWEKLKTTYEKDKFLKKNMKKFKELNKEIKNTADAEKFLSMNTNEVVDAMISRARAEAHLAAAKELVNKIVEAQLKIEQKQAEMRKIDAMESAELFRAFTTPGQNISEVLQFLDGYSARRKELKADAEKEIKILQGEIFMMKQALAAEYTKAKNGGAFEEYETEKTKKEIKERQKAYETYKQKLQKNIDDIQKKIDDLKDPQGKDKDKLIKLEADLSEAKATLDKWLEDTHQKKVEIPILVNSEKWFEDQKKEKQELQAHFNIDSDDYNRIQKEIDDLDAKKLELEAKWKAPELRKELEDALNDAIKNDTKEVKIKFKLSEKLDKIQGLYERKLYDIQQDADTLEVSYNSLYATWKKINKLVDEYTDKLEDATLPQATKDEYTLALENANKMLKTYEEEIDKLKSKLGELQTQYKTVLGEQKDSDKEVEAVQNRSDAWASYSEMMSSVGNAMGIIKDEEAAMIAQFAANTGAMIADMISRIAALKAEAMAAYLAGTAETPGLVFPANIAAAATVFATIMGILGSIPKFAEGGIVGGSSYSGDKILARLNSGEGVLTKQGLRNLTDIANSGPEVQAIALTSVRVKGSDIYLSQENYKKINHIN